MLKVQYPPKQIRKQLLSIREHLRLILFYQIVDFLFMHLLPNNETGHLWQDGLIELLRKDMEKRGLDDES